MSNGLLDGARLSLGPSTGRRGPPGPEGQRGVTAFEEAGGDASRREVRDVVALCAEHAPGLFPLLLSDTALPTDILRRPLEHEDAPDAVRRQFFDATREIPVGDDEAMSEALRRLRHRALVRIALREVLGLADIDRTSAETAELAEAAIDVALDAARRAVTARHGDALQRGGGGGPVPLTVLGMGKLGGRELNLGSDVDLCFFYETDDAVVGDGLEITPHEVFGRIASRTTRLLSEVTAHGFVFRVDLRLRPEGSRGPLVNSLASAERYYETFGQTWERAALLRARPVAGDRAFGGRLLETLRPFVYRRRVDPAIPREMASLLERSRVELDVSDDDIKLGPGGIREAEFFVQTLQLLWGGRSPELQVANTMEAVRRLMAAGHLTARDAERFEAAWALLRRVEHRIHVTAGYQTHALPRDPEARERMAWSLGFASWVRFEGALRSAREVVGTLFGSLAEPAPDEPPPALVAVADAAADGCTDPALPARLGRLLRVTDPDAAVAHLRRLGRRPEGPFGAFGRRERPHLAPRLLEELRASTDPDRALRYLADFFGRLGGTWGYDRLLDEEPRLARRLVGLFGASPPLADALVRHPESIDDVLAGRAPTPDEIARAHEDLVPEAARDPERLVSTLRRRKRDVSLGVGIAFVGGELDLAEVESRLTALAEAQLAAAFRFAIGESRTQGRPPPAMAVAGLGKLGGRELGFGGDLDLFFAYQGTPPSAGSGGDDDELEVATRVAQRAMRLLSQPDVEGDGYETDIRLRPGGSQGLLVVSLEAFDRYHAGRAEAWERQALVRARSVVGDPDLTDALAARFAHLAFEAGPPAPEELARLRRRIEEELAGERRDRLHPKLGWGGLVDIEFLVQRLQMTAGPDHPEVRVGRTLNALDALVGIGALPGGDGDVLREGHRFFRAVEQALRLVDPGTAGHLPLAGRTLTRVARFLGVRERDGLTAEQALMSSWRRHARAVRTLFESHLAEVGTPAPFEAPA